MKYLLFLVFGIFMVSCSIKSKSYYLLEGDKSIMQTHKGGGVIGIETVELPRYFNQNNLAIKEGKNKVSFTSQAHWISDMDEHLTSVLVAFLKRYFNTTDIYLYPWDVKKNINKKVDLKIENFIYQDGKVVLDASWEISIGTSNKAKFFHTSVVSKQDSDSIVKSMDKAFGKLEKEIAKSLK
jgi:uncharacterized lipoprotein YmbA